MVVPDGGVIPEGRPDIYLLGRDGVYKRGTAAELDLLIQLGVTPQLPGLAALAPSLTFRPLGPGARLPGHLLDAALAAARAACEQAESWVEWQGFVVVDPATGQPVLAAPAPRTVSGTTVVTTWPERLLADIHSHHRLPAFFSTTDDADDQWLSLSIVIGDIDHRYPSVVCRLNIYGHQQIVPAEAVFADLGLHWHDRVGAGGRADIADLATLLDLAVAQHVDRLLAVAQEQGRQPCEVQRGREGTW